MFSVVAVPVSFGWGVPTWPLSVVLLFSHKSQVTWDPPSQIYSNWCTWTSPYYKDSQLCLLLDLTVQGPPPSQIYSNLFAWIWSYDDLLPSPPSQLQGQLVFQLKSLLILFILFYCIIILAGTTKLNTSILNLSAVIAHNSLSSAKPLIVDLILKLLGLNLWLKTTSELK